jgi:hypothetical protein
VKLTQEADRVRQQEIESEVSFKLRAGSALGISIIADALDYVGAPIFALPIIGDISDLIVTGLLYNITKSKVSVVINSVEFIPIIGDFIPTYTISTVLWILNESRKRHHNQHHDSSAGQNYTTNRNKNMPTVAAKPRKDIQARIMRAYAALRGQV